MKKFLSTLLALALLLTCVSAFAQTSDDSLQKVLDKGELILGLDASFPPMGFTDEKTGEIVGFDIDVAKEVCSRLGVTLKCQPIDWAAKEMELNAGNIDCIWNGMTITDERKESMSISVPYLQNEQVVVVKNDSGISALADLAGKKLALQAGSSANDALDAAADFKASLGEVVPMDENMTALMDLNIGGVDAVLVDIIVANYYITINDYPFTVLEESLAPEQYGIGLRKTDAALTDAINNALFEMVKDGKLAEISNTWFSSDITVVADSMK